MKIKTKNLENFILYLISYYLNLIKKFFNLENLILKISFF
jgi:hypothetical protein